MYLSIVNSLFDILSLAAARTKSVVLCLYTNRQAAHCRVRTRTCLRALGTLIAAHGREVVMTLNALIKTRAA